MKALRIETGIWSRFWELVQVEKLRIAHEGLPDPENNSLNVLTRRLVDMVADSDSVSNADDPGHRVWDVLHVLVQEALGADGCPEQGREEIVADAERFIDQEVRAGNLIRLPGNRIIEAQNLFALPVEEQRQLQAGYGKDAEE